MPLLLAPAADPLDLRERLDALRRRWRRAVLVRGVCTLAAGALGAAVIVGLLDYALNAPALVRAAVLVGLLTAGGLFLRRGLLQPLRELNDDLALALRVESHFPALNDALASTVQFLDRPDDDPGVGSPALRRATRRYALREAEDGRVDRRRRRTDVDGGRPARVGRKVRREVVLGQANALADRDLVVV